VPVDRVTTAGGAPRPRTPMPDSSVMPALLATLAVLTRAGGGSGGGSSGGSGGGSFSGGSGGGGFFFFGGGGFGTALFIAFIGWQLYKGFSNQRRQRHGEPESGLPAQPVSQSGQLLGSGTGAVTTREALQQGLAEITAHDPGFNEADFLSDVNRAFFTIQQAWTERRPEISRQVMHDGIWQQHQFQIQQYLTANKANVLENLAIQNTRLVAADSDDAFDTIVVRFFASCADYDIDLSDDKHKVTRGSKRIEPWAEDWVFQRSAKAVTKPNGGTMAKKCPNCGAPLDLDLAGICKYCRAPVMSGEFDWVLTRIEQLPSYEYAQQSAP